MQVVCCLRLFHVRSLILIVALNVCLAHAVRGDELSVLRPEDAANGADKLLYEHLHQAFDKRTARYEAVQTIDDCHAYQHRLRTFFVQQLGGFPARTPLNAEVVGKLPGDGYTIEKVLFDSQPSHRVTATMYVPEGEGPFPCVVVACGHSRTAKAAYYNQRFGIVMAKNGMAALCYDPIGQGERSMILNDLGEHKHEGTTTEHFQIGVGSILIGTNTARYRTWDAMRAIDYVQSRADVDGDRIGFTGCSGGGTLTSYVMALDDRVTCAAPSCYLTTMRNLIDTIGPQDAEQNIFGQIAFGMDHPDYVLMRAPRPTIISATNDDFFSIEGTWDNFRQAKRFYGRLGHSERVDLVEGDGKHGVPVSNLNAIMRWMRRWLLDKDDAPTTTEFQIRSVAELQCTPDGQVLKLPGQLSVADLNTQWLSKLADARVASWDSLDADAKRESVRAAAGIRRSQSLPQLTAESRGTVARDGYTIEKLLLRSQGSMPLPALYCSPSNSTGRWCVYVPGAAAAVFAADHKQLSQFTEQGDTVLIIDVPGIGETRPKGADGPMGAWKEYYLAYLLGRSLVGIRAEATLQAVEWLKSKNQGKLVHLIADGETAIAALHAAAVSDDCQSVELSHTIKSWLPIVAAPETNNELVNTIHGVLRVYDLPDLVTLHGSVAFAPPITSGLGFRESD